MKKIIIVLTVLFAAPSFAETIHVGVQGMVCAFCAKGLEKSFSARPEINGVKVDLDKKLITLETKPEQTLSDTAIKDIITHAGFNVSSTHREK